MNIKPRTVRSEALFGDLFANFPEDRANALAEEYGMTPEAMTGQVITYLSMCARVEFDEGEVDFELATGRDNPDILFARFTAFLESECVQTVAKIIREIDPLSRFIDEALRPAPPPDTEKN